MFDWDETAQFDHGTVGPRIVGWYDRFRRAVLPRERFNANLVHQAHIQPGHRVLDLANGSGDCGVSECVPPAATVVGVKMDRLMLRVARDPIRRHPSVLEVHQAQPLTALFAPRSFDRVVSGFLFHHLDTEEKRRVLLGTRALLRPGGELHVADWGESQNLTMRLAFLGIEFFTGRKQTSDNVQGWLIPLMREAGFVSVEETHCEMTLLGTLSFYRAVVPS